MNTKLTIGHICGDSTGLRVKVEDVDIYERVHLTVIEGTEDDPLESGEMSFSAFARHGDWPPVLMGQDRLKAAGEGRKLPSLRSKPPLPFSEERGRFAGIPEITAEDA